MNPSCRLTYSPDGLHFHGPVIVFRINGLITYNLDRLRVTLKASLPGATTAFHIDTLDLYVSRARDAFVETCSKQLQIKPEVVTKDLTELITILEEERMRLREQGNEKAIPPMSDKEKDDALKLAKSKDLLKQIIADFDAIGYIGEKYNKLLGYIATVSRLRRIRWRC